MAAKRKRRVHIQEDARGDWYFKLVGGNGEIITTSEGHKNLDDCIVIATETNPGIEAILHEGGYEVVLSADE